MVWTERPFWALIPTGGYLWKDPGKIRPAWDWVEKFLGQLAIPNPQGMVFQTKGGNQGKLYGWRTFKWFHYETVGLQVGTHNGMATFHNSGLIFYWLGLALFQTKNQKKKNQPRFRP